MKRFLKITTLLFVVAALAVSCKTNTDNDGLSGKWNKSVVYEEAKGCFTMSGSTYLFKSLTPAECSLTQNEIIRWPQVVTKEAVVGVKLKMKCSSRSAGHGLYFVDPNDSNTYYRLAIRNSCVLLTEKKNGQEKDMVFKEDSIAYWMDFRDSINQEPQENEIAFYTAKDGSIKLLINGKNITSIDAPNITSFTITAFGQIAYDDADVVTASYEFLKFQTSK